MTAISDLLSIEGLVSIVRMVPFSHDKLGISLVYLVFFLLLLWGALKSIKKILEHVVGIVESLSKLGLPFVPGRERRQFIRRRQQFSTVLRSDLDSIAKAENWNDQLFADLEAEVEAEGGYFLNPLSRLFNRRSSGIRRVPSLVEAIRTGTERCMLLVGDPGSGKSVALRHLARMLADQCCLSTRQQTLVPLYINLRELPPCKPEELNADFINKFVQDHVRRGDADTGAYVREHWREFKENGTFFFLFDSFDEIPAILHAPNGSRIISVHSNALRLFMDGMGSCRGVLASREYKGPESLPWHKLRILPLDQKRQSRLIGNTLLSDEQKDLVFKHLAAVNTGIYGNPLFLSLLCRFIGGNNIAPRNDHDLLSTHVERLARRDTDYVFKKYGMTPEALIEGAKHLAIILAEQRDLSLAPTFDEVSAAFKARRWVGETDLERLLSALIDVKICRSDVKEARQGDRRIAFSHRRYQESLFVHFLAGNPGYVSKRDLLLDIRWREFTVTLIQSQPEEIVAGFTEEAILQIDALEENKLPLRKDFHADVHYFNWGTGPLLHLLNLLNEGFAPRLGIVPSSLRKAISRQLLPRWIQGDYYDKLMVVRHGCLLPGPEYQKILQWSIDSNVDHFRFASFNNSKFIGELSDSMRTWVCDRFASEVLVAENSIELQRLDALGSALPKATCAERIFKRCRSLRKYLFIPWPNRIAIALIEYPLNSISQISLPLRNVEISRSILRLKIVVLLFTFVLSVTTYTTIRIFIEKFSLGVRIAGGITLLLLIIMSIRLMFMSYPAALTPMHICKKILSLRAILSNKNAWIGIGIFGAMGGLFAIVTKFDARYLIGIIYLPIVADFIRHYAMKASSRKRLLRLTSSGQELRLWDIVKHAETIGELSIWIEGLESKLLDDMRSLRDLLRSSEVRFGSNKSQESNSPLNYLLANQVISYNQFAKKIIKKIEEMA